jgi:hypothetical protein
VTFVEDLSKTQKVKMEGTEQEGVSVESTAITTVEVDGSSYFVVDRNRGNGDRRSDGRKMVDFFVVKEGERAKKQRLLYDPSQGCERKKSKVLNCGSAHEHMFQLTEYSTTPTAVVAERLDTERVSAKKATESLQCVESTMEREETNVTLSTEQEQDESKELELVSLVPPRVPDKAIRCAGRKRTSRLLWLHEFFRVYECARSKNKFPWIYQALKFKVGAQLPEGVVQEMSDTMRNEIWVLGVCYVPVMYVRKFSKRVKGYMFHTELNDEDGDKALYGNCPEIVRVENCLKWHPMSTVSRDVPRIVHADDVKNRRVHVAGRCLHFVCGATAVEDLQCSEFRLSRLPRQNLFMYPEERSGYDLNSASSMWEQIDGVFSQIRQCMSSARLGTTSASFNMPLSVASFEFWKVCTNICFFFPIPTVKPFKISA